MIDPSGLDVYKRQAEARLPAEVVQNGISVEKQAASKLMTITLLSSDPKFDEIYLSNLSLIHIFVVSSCRLRVSSLSFLRNCPVSLRLAGMAVRSEI